MYQMTNMFSDKMSVWNTEKFSRLGEVTRGIHLTSASLSGLRQRPKHSTQFWK